MNPKAIIGIVVVIALLAAGYVWYTNQPSAMPPQVLDTTEKPPAEEPSAAAIANGIEGTWRSMDDARFTRSFDAGVVTDRYEGEPDVTGHYELDSDHVPAQVRAAAGDSPVLSIEFPEEALFFTVVKLDAKYLELSYAGRGNTLKFERI